MFLLTFTFVRDTILSRQSGGVCKREYMCVYVYVCRFIIYPVFAVTMTRWTVNTDSNS